ncbi:hypothetical protein PABY_12040 [Pyrodictium abyssi]|uniref:Uncharacterized protein n=1 Tax=Pyrodictium abyssi TaxID=54256 RepID=A0ABN6ZTT0_9CREN|nr:hypothetical protein PABY_12040 [Pyrodictium abyssi]
MGALCSAAAPRRGSTWHDGGRGALAAGPYTVAGHAGSCWMPEGTRRCTAPGELYVDEAYVLACL